MTAFLLPPQTRRADGALRRAGVEFEYADVSLPDAARVVQEIFGGEVSQHSAFVWAVEGNRHGRFRLEIDSSVLKKRKYRGTLAKLGISPDLLAQGALEDSLMRVFAMLVPYEIITPPLPFDQLEILERLRERLQEHGAQGTQKSLLHAFGLHFNVEVASHEPAQVLDTLRAFILLQPYLKRRREMDLTRRVSGYAQDFPEEYAELILDEAYQPSAEELLDDYVEHNPTRNRALDLLPLLAVWDKQRVCERVEAAALIQARPAYHYRAPNSLFGDRQWKIADEWNCWVVMVERLAADAERLAELSGGYLNRKGRLLDPFEHALSRFIEEHTRWLSADL